MPPVFAESTETLAPGKVGVTIGGAGGGAGTFGCGLCSAPIAEGAFLRVRVGIGERQELGAVAFGALTQSTNGGGIGAIGGGALSYKLAASKHVAFVADAGAIDQAFTGDVALIFALYTDSHGRQLYSGLRGSAATTIGVLDGGSSFGVTAPLGFVLRPTKNTRLFLEAGAFAGRSRAEWPDGSIPVAGGYASIAIAILSR